MVDLTNITVLLVEDEPIVAMDLQDSLEAVGATVIGPASNLAQAERLSDHPDLAVAILDVRLGQETIFPVAEKLAQREVGLILHTGHESPARLLERWPASKVFIKPARVDDLIAAAAALSRSS